MCISSIGTKDAAQLVLFSDNAVAPLTTESFCRWLPIVVTANFDFLSCTFIRVQFRLCFLLGKHIERSTHKCTSSLAGAA